MTSSTESSSAPESAPAERPAHPWWTALDYGLRALCVVAVVWVVWEVIPLAARILGGGAVPAKNEPVDLDEPVVAPRILAAGPKPGPWRAEGSEWDFRLGTVPAAEVDSQMDRLAEKATGIPRAVEATGKELLKALRAVAKIKELPNSRREYRMDAPQIKLTAITLVAPDGERILTGAAAWKQESDDWQWLELVPRGDVAQPDAPQMVSRSSHLLPLPAPASVVASRWSNEGELLLEIVSSPLSFLDFKTKWKEQGYSLHPAQGAAPQAPAGGRGPGSQAWFCVRGQELIYVWSTTQASHTTLLLARTSSADAAETSGESSQPTESTP